MKIMNKKEIFQFNSKSYRINYQSKKIYLQNLQIKTNKKVQIPHLEAVKMMINSKRKKINKIIKIIIIINNKLNKVNLKKTYKMKKNRN